MFPLALFRIAQICARLFAYMERRAEIDAGPEQIAHSHVSG